METLEETQLSLGALKPKPVMPKCGYVMHELLRVLDGWSVEELANLAAAFSKGLPPAKLETEEIKAQIQDCFHYAFNHTFRLTAAAVCKNAAIAIRNIFRWARAKTCKSDEWRKIPYTRPYLLGKRVDYPFLVKATAKALKVDDAALNPELPEDRHRLELYIAQRVIVTALDRMTPDQRCKFFTGEMDTSRMAAPASLIKDARETVSPLTFMARAQASGAGLAATASTALGFVTHAAGITLPFVVYKGMASTIAFSMGPAGWLGAGLWMGLRLTRPNWRKLSSAIIYIAAVREARKTAV